MSEHLIITFNVITLLQIMCACEYVIYLYYSIFTDNEDAKFKWFKSVVTGALLCFAVGAFPL